VESPLGVAIKALHREVGGVVEDETLGDPTHVRLVLGVIGLKVAREHLAIVRDGGEEVGAPGSGLAGGVKGGKV